MIEYALICGRIRCVWLLECIPSPLYWAFFTITGSVPLIFFYFSKLLNFISSISDENQGMAQGPYQCSSLFRHVLSGIFSSFHVEITCQAAIAYVYPVKPVPVPVIHPEQRPLPSNDPAEPFPEWISDVKPSSLGRLCHPFSLC